MNVIIYGAKKFEIEPLERANQGKHHLIFVDEELNEETAIMAKGAGAISIFTNDNGSAEVLNKLKNYGINCIAIRAAGYDQVDLQRAGELDIKVTNVPEYSPYSIAEHTIAMIMALNRNIVSADAKVKRNDFTLNGLVGFDMYQKTVGIIGIGRIGGLVAKILHGFGCRILAYDINPHPEITDQYGVEYVSLDDLCRQSDIITLHAPANEHTRYMINKEKMNIMKNGVMIINTGRGILINTQDAIEALKEGKIGYLGLDVYEKEKGLFFYDHSNEILKDDMFARLQTFKNVLITGHQSFLTGRALQNIADTTIYNLDCFARNEPSVFELQTKEVHA